MNKEGFTNNLKERLEEITGYEVKIQPTTKNNGVKLTGLIIMREGQNASPTIYAEYYYELYDAGKAFEEIVEKILETEEKNRINYNLDETFFLDFNRVQANLYYKIVNYAANSERLKDIPYKQILDLAKIYYVGVEMKEIGTGTILITNEHLKLWGVKLEEMDVIATSNTETKLQPTVAKMSDIIKGKLFDMFEDEEPEMIDLEQINYPCMYVASNQRGVYGASTLIYNNLLKIIAKEVKDDLIIFPSSIHEFIFMAAGLVGRDLQELKEIVETVNLTAVDKEEFLSDNVYFYSRKQNELTIAK